MSLTVRESVQLMAGIEDGSEMRKPGAFARARRRMADLLVWVAESYALEHSAAMSGYYVVDESPRQSLPGALGLKPGELVAIVGGGGKTALLQRLARDLAASGHSVIVATTTHMFLAELACLGQTVVNADEDGMIRELEAALAVHGGRSRRVAGAARGHVQGGKVRGLRPEVLDEFGWLALADYVLVEADGSRGKPLKAFGLHEPAVPVTASTIVQVAGLDAIGLPLTADVVHRAEVLSGALGVPLGEIITERTFVACLQSQLATLRAQRAGARVVTFLNKSEGSEREAIGRGVAEALMSSSVHPATVVVGSLVEDRFFSVSGSSA